LIFSESTCSGVSKISNLFLCTHFWVNKYLSMMALFTIYSLNWGAISKQRLLKYVSGRFV
jgi:hypothetical protein